MTENFCSRLPTYSFSVSGGSSHHGRMSLNFLFDNTKTLSLQLAKFIHLQTVSSCRGIQRSQYRRILACHRQCRCRLAGFVNLWIPNANVWALSAATRKTTSQIKISWAPSSLTHASRRLWVHLCEQQLVRAPTYFDAKPALFAWANKWMNGRSQIWSALPGSTFLRSRCPTSRNFFLTVTSLKAIFFLSSWQLIIYNWDKKKVLSGHCGRNNRNYDSKSGATVARLGNRH